MSNFPVRTIETAPDAAREALRELGASVGFLPNLAAAMANSPLLLRAFLTLRDLASQGTFTPAEIQVISLTSAYENRCAWCMAFHSFMALKVGVSRASVDALRAGASPVEPRLAALSDHARRLVRGRGAVTPSEVEAFVAAGYAPAQALEVLVALGFALMANYAGHLVEAPLDPPFQPHAWAPPGG